jgi:hypothetical protein
LWRRGGGGREGVEEVDDDEMEEKIRPYLI